MATQSHNADPQNTADTGNYSMTAQTPPQSATRTGFYDNNRTPMDWDDATWILTSSFIIFTMQSGECY